MPKLDTLAIHAGQEPDPTTGSVMTPIYQTSTFAQPKAGEGIWHYARTHNPTRKALEDCLAKLEGGQFGLCFSSGMSAIDAIIRSLSPGDVVLCGDDVYGGTYRLFTRAWSRFGIVFHFVDMSDANFEIPDKTKLLWLETPTNPLLKTSDIASIAKRCKVLGATLVVDNTFATPVFQQPLSLGADLVVHSTTKYLNGHSDVVGGAIITNDDYWAERLAFIQNSAGAVPSPQDCFLILRGLKTLHVRMERHQFNAQQLVAWFEQHPKVRRVCYPGFGGMISVELEATLEQSALFVQSTTVFTLAESLGGVESLIGVPAIMTHASVPPELRRAVGITDGLIRLSVGIEHIVDLIEDLERAFAIAMRA